MLVKAYGNTSTAGNTLEMGWSEKKNGVDIQF